MYPSTINDLIESFKFLPGIGSKTAQRLAFSILDLDKDQVDQLFKDIAAQAYRAYSDPIQETTEAFAQAIGSQSNKEGGAVWELGQLSLYAKNAANKLALLPSVIQEVMDKIKGLDPRSPGGTNPLKITDYNIDDVMQALYFNAQRPQGFWKRQELPLLANQLGRLNQNQLNNVYNTINLSAGQWTIDELLNYIARIINPANTSIK